jgi:hypothetical protein
MNTQKLYPHPKIDTQLRKLIKHYFSNTENWWELKSSNGDDAGISWWIKELNQMRVIYSTSLGNWDDKNISIIISVLKEETNKEYLDKKLEQYNSIYFNIVEKSFKETIKTSRRKGVSGRLNGRPKYAYCFTHKRPQALTNIYAGKDGIVVITNCPSKDSAASITSRNLITAYRANKYLRKNRRKLVQYLINKA